MTTVIITTQKVKTKVSRHLASCREEKFRKRNKETLVKIKKMKTISGTSQYAIERNAHAQLYGLQAWDRDQDSEDTAALEPGQFFIFYFFLKCPPSVGP